MSRLSINCLLAVVLFTCSTHAFACSPVFHDVSDYLEGRIPSHVIFLGTVTSTEERKVEWGTRQKIEMRVTKWFDGPGSKTITVNGGLNDVGKDPCRGIFNFFTKVGDQWLIFGQLYEGVVNPDTSLTRPAPNGYIDPSLIKQISKKR